MKARKKLPSLKKMTVQKLTEIQMTAIQGGVAEDVHTSHGGGGNGSLTRTTTGGTGNNYEV